MPNGTSGGVGARGGQPPPATRFIGNMTLRLIAGMNRYIDRAEMVVEQSINKRNV